MFEPRCEFVAFLRRVIYPNRVTASDVTKRTQAAYFDKDCSLGIPRHSHAGLENHIRPSLRRQIQFVIRLGRATQIRAQLCQIIWCEKDHDGLCIREGHIQHLTHVGCSLSRKLHCLSPLHRVEIKRPQESKHAVSKSAISSVDYEDISRLQNLTHDSLVPPIAATGCAPRVSINAHIVRLLPGVLTFSYVQSRSPFQACPALAFFARAAFHFTQSA